MSPMMNEKEVGEVRNRRANCDMTCDMMCNTAWRRQLAK